MTKPLPCPFCGVDPEVQPTPSSKAYSHAAWAEVLCRNDDCAAHPYVMFGTAQLPHGTTEQYHEGAVLRWNKRA